VTTTQGAALRVGWDCDFDRLRWSTKRQFACRSLRDGAIPDAGSNLVKAGPCGATAATIRTSASCTAKLTTTFSLFLLPPGMIIFARQRHHSFFFLAWLSTALSDDRIRALADACRETQTVGHTPERCSFDSATILAVRCGSSSTLACSTRSNYRQ